MSSARDIFIGDHVKVGDCDILAEVVSINRVLCNPDETEDFSFTLQAVIPAMRGLFSTHQYIRLSECGKKSIKIIASKISREKQKALLPVK